jgi:uncharacterized protein YecE (DUF72 family)
LRLFGCLVPGETIPLFDEPPEYELTPLGQKLAALASRNILVGTSSWKYEGWLGQIYSPERYTTRGKFSQKRFQAECLGEYAANFPIVCGDFSFYQFPSEEYWRRLFSSAPHSLKYALKVPEEITVRVFPAHARYSARAGQPNPTFLNTLLFRSAFLDVLEPYREQVAVLIFEFGTFGKQIYANVHEFVAQLDPFLGSLPTNFRYAVEVRNQEFLVAEYFTCLRNHGVAHVLNSWTRMPDMTEQMLFPEVFTADFTVSRALLRKGRPYEEAVAKFAPYQQVLEPNHEVRQALRNLIARARDRAEPSYIFINNRLEGNAPQTIEAILD